MICEGVHQFHCHKILSVGEILCIIQLCIILLLLPQIYMSVRMGLTVVMRMQTVLILLEVTLVHVHLAILVME